MIYQGDALTVLKTLPDASVNCCVCSPPYYGLRDYGCAGQIGLESTPAEYIALLVEVFREVRRVLRGDGTLWVNIGDSYARNPVKGGSGPNGEHDSIPDYGNARKIMSESRGSSDGAVGRGDRAPVRNGAAGLKEKDLIGVPWMLAFALRDDGWYLRQDIIWAKGNCMPESVKDRCTKAHEYVFLLSKSPRYYYDADAIKEPASEGTHAPGVRTGNGSKHATSPNGFIRDKCAYDVMPETRNKRSVWMMATQPTPEAHFATFPVELPETCLLAGTKEGGTVLDPFCGAGTTGIACIKNRREFIGIELNPEYIEIANKRMGRHHANHIQYSLTEDVACGL